MYFYFRLIFTPSWAQKTKCSAWWGLLMKVYRRRLRLRRSWMPMTQCYRYYLYNSSVPILVWFLNKYLCFVLLAYKIIYHVSDNLLTAIADKKNIPKMEKDFPPAINVPFILKIDLLLQLYQKYSSFLMSLKTKNVLNKSPRNRFHVQWEWIWLK